MHTGQQNLNREQTCLPFHDHCYSSLSSTPIYPIQYYSVLLRQISRVATGALLHHSTRQRTVMPDISDLPLHEKPIHFIQGPAFCTVFNRSEFRNICWASGLNSNRIEFASPTLQTEAAYRSGLAVIARLIITPPALVALPNNLCELV